MERNPAFTLGPLHDERLRIDRIVDRLDLTDDLTERADLASELVKSVSRYEDTLERTLFARTDGLDNEEMEAQRHHLRDALRLIHKQTTGIDPRNVHTSDGQTFEDTLSDAVVTLRKLLSVEDRYIASFVGRLDPDERGQLTEEIAHAFSECVRTTRSSTYCRRQVHQQFGGQVRPQVRGCGHSHSSWF